MFDPYIDSSKALCTYFHRFGQNEGCDQRKKRSVQRSISDKETGSPRVREFTATHTTIQVNGYPEFYSKSGTFHFIFWPTSKDSYQSVLILAPKEGCMDGL